jgi:LuxR family transcriptional regulator, maltose regulon positive regulatory protein
MQELRTLPARRHAPRSHAPSPPGRDALVARPRLVRRLLSARGTPVVLLVAPAGYGKTALLSEWERRDGRSFAWVDPLDMEEGIEQALSRPGEGRDHVIVIDGLRSSDWPHCMRLLAKMIDQLEDPSSQLVLGSRTEPPLGLGALRAQRKLFELRTADLAMTLDEAAELVTLRGLALDQDELEPLVRRTEGWPAALYLATLAAHQERHPSRALASFGGEDRFVADYIGDEVLEPLGAQQLSFLARSSVLGSLSGPLCDFVLERADSARQLKRLSRMNLMLVPLDRSDEEYRYHRLFAQALRAELRRSEPEMEALLHRRAALWYLEHGDVERSIEHAIAGGDDVGAGKLLWSHSASILGFGQSDQLAEWLEAFDDVRVAACPTLALSAAAHSLAAGDRDLVEYWTSAAQRALDGSEDAALEGEALLLRAAVAEDRVTGMGELAAAAAAAGVPDDSPWRALGCLLEGVAAHLTGERERAREILEEGARRSAARAPNLQALCLAQLALLALDRHDLAAAESLAARARAQVVRSGLSSYPTSALVFAVASDVEAQLGRVEASQAHAREAAALLEGLTDFSPWYEAECRIALARGTLRLSDTRQARQLLDEAARQLQRVPDAGVALAWIEECRAQAELSSTAGSGRDCSLTTAELRILQFLPTHLSFPEIAERLYVSANTVKTHARSVYRKLGASSRGEAVSRARNAGLLDEATHAGVAWPA